MKSAPDLAESRGRAPLYWEEVKPGEKVPQVVRGLAVADIMTGMPASGATHYGGVHGDALRYQRHADYHLNKQTGARESAGRVSGNFDRARCWHGRSL